MLINPLITKMGQLRLSAMVKAFKEQLDTPGITELSFEDRLGLLIDVEVTSRENRRLTARLRKARLQQSASFEDIDYYSPRHLDKALLASLSQCQWINGHQNILIVGPCGTGKTFLACALAHKACLFGYTALYYRTGRLLSELQLGKGDGQYRKRMAELAKVDVLILDDFGLSPLTDDQRRDLLEILDDRHDKRSTLVTSQLPVKHWHETIGNETLADAILDRLVHNAYRLEIQGESMRKTRKTLGKQKDSSTETQNTSKAEDKNANNLTKEDEAE